MRTKLTTFLLSALIGFSTFNFASAAAGSERSRIHHTFFGNHMGNYTMVSCHYAEFVAWEFMTKLGAKNLSMFCSGGIQPYGVYPINLDIQYDAPDLSGETQVTTVDILSRTWDSNCVYDTHLMQTLLREMPNLRKVSGNNHCFTPRDRYSYRIDVTLPAQ
jgi:hypothetical protein